MSNNNNNSELKLNDENCLNDEHCLNHQYCLYIQRIHVSFLDQDIRNLIENYFFIGKISCIKYVKKTQRFISILVYFSFVHLHSFLIEMWCSIENGRSFKLVLYQKPKFEYWVVRRKYMLHPVLNIMVNKINVLEECVQKQNENIHFLTNSVHELKKKIDKIENVNNFTLEEEKNYVSESGSPHFHYISDSSSEESLFSKYENLLI